jgi:hypothetical protein
MYYALASERFYKQSLGVSDIKQTMKGEFTGGSMLIDQVIETVRECENFPEVSH